MKTVRLFVLLIVSYVKTHWKLFCLGLTLGLSTIYLVPKLLNPPKPPLIGLSGDYTLSTLPLMIQKEVSLGLTKIESDSQITPSAAKSWKFSDGDRTVTFDLDTSLSWQNGEKFSSESINYNLKSVVLTRPDPGKITLTLKEPFAPLLSIVSQPLFKNGLVGLGNWQVISVNFNGRFVSSLTLKNKNDSQIKIYKFFPDEPTTLLALKLGSIREADNLYSLEAQTFDNHYKVTSSFSTTSVVALFFNLDREFLSDKSFRQGLIYALPNSFVQGQKAFAPIRPESWAQTAMIKRYSQNPGLAKKSITKIASNSAVLKLNLNTTRSLEPVARIIGDSWSALGINSDIHVTDIPDPTFDAFLTTVELPVDPDQYSLWHSTQPGNISHYKSPKVDKLLEEGRKTLNKKERQEIYANFLKAITEDAPAAFLFYPKLYSIKRLTP